MKSDISKPIGCLVKGSVNGFVIGPAYYLAVCFVLVLALQVPPLFAFDPGAVSDAVSADDLRAQPSPYLRAHADDAVRWQAFGTAAFEQARRLDKPILLSSGYLSCYWCHRMAEDSFRVDSVGEVINEQFVPILLDRELEPEVDAYLQTFMTQQRGFGGWPLTVILTPDAKLIAGFSYQKADTVLATLSSFAASWSTQRSAVETSANAKVKRLMASFDSGETTFPLNLKTLLNNFLSQTERIADNDLGGFGQTEKFPFAPQLATLLKLDEVQQDPLLRQFLETTLQAMLGGGLRDHVGGGFFRYSDTREWSAPHFEQMLTTQALLAPLLLQAGKQWRKPTYLTASREVLLAMIEFFQRDDGLFRAGLSAVSKQGVAGGYYLWPDEQLRQLLGDEMSAVYPLPQGNQQSGESQFLPLILVNGKPRLNIRNRLLEARSARTLNTDNKALLGWNGLALSALANGAALSPQINVAGKRLYKQLLPLLTADEIPRLLGVKNAGPAQLADKVYLAKGLADWGGTNKDIAKGLSEPLAKFLVELHQTYYHAGKWLGAINKPLIGNLRSPALVDTELPSPTGIWLALANLLIDDSNLDRETLDPLQQAFNEVKKQLPDTLEESAFLHGTTLSTLLISAIQKTPAKETTQ